MGSTKSLPLGPVTRTNSKGQVKLVGLVSRTLPSIFADDLNEDSENSYKIMEAVLPHQEWIKMVIYGYK